MGRRFLPFIIAVLAVGAAFFLVPRHRPAASETWPMPNDVYIWQRAWTDRVREAVVEHGTNFTELVVLNAEVSWKGRVPRAVKMPLDFSALQKSGRRIGLALRIGAYAGPFRADNEQAQFLTGLAASLVAEAVSNRLSLAELQLDFDCAESKLDGYSIWVQAIQRTVAPVQVTITALPVWLKHSAFKRLIASVNSYVLQVHSLERPKIGAPFQLCDPGQAQRAVARAGQLGRPFRVALPTYGYVVAFDPAGRFLSVSAEGPTAMLAENIQRREITAQPQAIAQLIRSWTNCRPHLLTGVIWYRLPIAGERLNWPWPTLMSVMSGIRPQPDLRAQPRYPNPALVEIDLLNAGAADYSGPATVKVHWSKGREVAADALAGFELIEVSPDTIHFQSRGAMERLEPGERRNIGWVRLDEHAEVQMELAP